MKDILDNIEVNNRKQTFTHLSLVCVLVSLSCFGYLLNLLSNPVLANDTLYNPPLLLVRSAQISSVLGVVMVAFSFVKKEPSGWKKWLAAVVNITLFLLIVGSVGFYYFIEMTQ
ncbi:MAG: hypothetical protein AAF990_10030 [Bacteroidota bacterium]